VEADTTGAEVHPFVTPDLLVATCTGDGHRLSCNDAWRHVLGDGPLWGHLPPEDVPFATAYLTDAARGFLVTHQVFLVARPDRDLPAPVLLHFFPVRLPGGKPGRLPVLVVGEVLEEPASWAADQTRRRRMEVLGQMAMGVAHDFNNLLTTILGHIELLRSHIAAERSVFAEDMLGQIQTVERAATDGASLVRKIQQYIRHEKQERFEPVRLDGLIAEVLTLTRPYWYNEPRRRGITITLESDLQPTPPTLGWPPELRDVFVNLVLNAVQAMPAGGSLRLRTYADPARGAVAEVEDSGVGMTERVRTRIFEPFFTTKGEGGNGMGLTVCYGIVQEHNGTIEVESEPGRGTLFRLAFPSAKPARPPGRPTLAAGTGAHRRARILVVDDEPMVRTVTAQLLRLKGHTVVEAEGGPEALDHLDAAAFDLVVTDLSMPEMSGRELAHHVRRRLPLLPILLLTGDTDAQESTAYVDAVVQKPFKIDALEEVIQRVLGKNGAGDGK
jgi:signal transduction histidine kinase